ncbi:MAG TPA: RNA methyltransferase [Chitinophagaceae bacterium]|nr:RNA methyltransferase [Chitinophagaceae bacterium]
MTEERRKRLETVLSFRQNDITVVLEDVWDPHNISAVMRSCDAVGIQEIYVLNTKIEKHDQWGRRSSSSAHKWLTVHQFDKVSECVSVLKSKYDKVLSTHLSSDAVSLYDLSLTGRVALVFGNEHEGISDELRQLTDGNFVIPQVGMIQSLNISVACAVSLYEAFRQKMVAGHYKEQRLSPSQYAEISIQWGLEDEAS